MKRLSKNWLTEGILDFEYKKYVLLAYLQSVQKYFDAHRLYPAMGDLIEHYQSMIQFQVGKDAFKEGMNKDMIGIDIENQKILYQENEIQDDFLLEIDKVLNFAIPKFENHLDQGKDIYEEIAQSINIYPVGVLALYKKEGFFILNNERKSFVFKYAVDSIRMKEGRYQTLSTNFITAYTMNYSTTFNTIRKELLNSYKQFDNPATYVLETKEQVPIKETFLPIAKRSLLKYLLAA